MARARNIKPGFFTNDELVELPFEVRLLFIGLWTIADKEGRLADRPKKIKMEIFPADDVDCDKALSLLAGKGFIRRYRRDDNGYVQICNWDRHQNPHIKEAPSVIPAENEAAPEIPVQAPEIPERAGLIPDSLNRIPDSGLQSCAPAAPDSPAAQIETAKKGANRGTQLGRDWVLPKAWGEWALAERPDWNDGAVRRCADKFRDHWVANANQSNGKKSDWEAAWHNWVRKENPPRGSPGNGSKQAALEERNAEAGRELKRRLFPELDHASQ